MASLLTARDHELFGALVRAPLTVRQVLRLSATFAAPFPSLRRLQRRLRKLTQSGLLRQWWYATEGRGSESYYTLSPQSVRLVLGQRPGGLCRPVGISQQHHSRSLAELIVHTLVAARRAGIAVTDFHRENALDLAVAGQHLRPDAAFTLAGVPALQFYVELDNSSEPVASDKDRDNFRRKLAFYEALRDACGYRFRVLGVVTKSAARLEHLLATAAAVAGNPQRALFYGIRLADYLAQPDPLRQACFRDHRGRAVALVPAAAAAPSRNPLAPRALVC